MARASTRKHPSTARAVDLVLPYGMWNQIRDYVLGDLARERACYLLCGRARAGGRLQLLGCYLVTPLDTDYSHQSIAGVAVERSLLTDVLKECARLGLSLIDIHSHPFAVDHVAFSGTDDADEIEKARWFAQHLPKSYYGSLVIGQKCYAGRMRLAKGIHATVELKVQAIEDLLTPRSPRAKESSAPWVERHVRAFGEDGQRRLGDAKVGIVGLGGLGAAVAQGLARLGVDRFVLIDPDNVEPHNLNRLAGMRASDAREDLSKVALANREIRAINPKAKCTQVALSVLEKEAWSKLLTCDVVVTATDNHASRMLLNTLSVQYLLPQVSVGSLIELDEATIKSACGHVRVVLPGPKRPCLMCSKIIDLAEVYYERAPTAQRREAVRRGYIANFDLPAPAVVHLNGVLANLAIVELHNLFSGFKEPSWYLFYDLLNPEVMRIIEEPSECATCSAGGGYYGRGDIVPLGAVFEELLP